MSSALGAAYAIAPLSGEDGVAPTAKSVMRLGLLKRCLTRTCHGDTRFPRYIVHPRRYVEFAASPLSIIVSVRDIVPGREGYLAALVLQAGSDGDAATLIRFLEVIILKRIGETRSGGVGK